MNQPAQLTLLQTNRKLGKKKKENPVWELLNLFEQGWSPTYCGEVYARGGRDLKAARDFLSLYPDFLKMKYYRRNSQSGSIIICEAGSGTSQRAILRCIIRFGE